MYACACVVSVCDECCYYCFQKNNVQIAVRVWFAGVCVCACVCVYVLLVSFGTYMNTSRQSADHGEWQAARGASQEPRRRKRPCTTQHKKCSYSAPRCSHPRCVCICLVSLCCSSRETEFDKGALWLKRREGFKEKKCGT